MITQFFGGILNLPVWLQIILFIAFIVGGMYALIKGADGFVSGASGIAKKLKVPAIIIGLTIVSIGTSLPEASVSISSAIGGSADISIGNVVGSNIFNLLIVLGLSLVFVPIALNKKLVLKDFVLMLVSGILLLIFALFGTENATLGRIECGILLAIFIAYIVYSIIEAKKANKQSKELSEQDDNKQETVKLTELKEKTEQDSTKLSKNILLLIAGLIGIIVGGDFVVFGAQNFALQIGMSEALVGLTIVAIGTSLPELVTSIVAARKGENEIALGNVIGSNIFNILFILGMSGLIIPLTVSASVMIDIVIMTVIFALFLIFSLIKKNLPKWLGYIMIGMYIVYLLYIILREFNIIG
ncbi:MAG: calcium/sodium antiporter [Clostridia bacterium]|nr:calcium/sodium antiporter [Clostridia bacterium]